MAQSGTIQAVMPLELESKIAVTGLDPVREKLRAAEAAYCGRVLETNRLLDNDSRRLAESGCGLRVRTVRAIDAANSPASGTNPPAEPGAEGGQTAHPDRGATMTFKGPLQEAAFKQREEIEFELRDSEGVVRLLDALGYQPWLTFEKRRESWRLPPCKVELDELPRLGCFVEVEGPTEGDIRAALAALGLDASHSITKSYAALIAEQVGGSAGGPIELRF